MKTYLFISFLVMLFVSAMPQEKFIAPKQEQFKPLVVHTSKQNQNSDFLKTIRLAELNIKADSIERVVKIRKILEQIPKLEAQIEKLEDDESGRKTDTVYIEKVSTITKQEIVPIDTLALLHKHCKLKHIL